MFETLNNFMSLGMQVDIKLTSNHFSNEGGLPLIKERSARGLPVIEQEAQESSFVTTTMNNLTRRESCVLSPVKSFRKITTTNNDVDCQTSGFIYNEDPCYPDLGDAKINQDNY